MEYEEHEHIGVVILVYNVESVETRIHDLIFKGDTLIEDKIKYDTTYVTPLELCDMFNPIRMN
jgi:hypothetical protein